MAWLQHLRISYENGRMWPKAWGRRLCCEGYFCQSNLGTNSRINLAWRFKRMKIQESFKIKKKSINQDSIKSIKIQSNQSRFKNEDSRINLVNGTSEAEFKNRKMSTQAAFGHLVRYLARSATRGYKWADWADLLVERKSPSVSVVFEECTCGQIQSVNRSSSEQLDRGKLLVSSSTTVNVTVKICLIWRSWSAKICHIHFWSKRRIN